MFQSQTVGQSVGQRGNSKCTICCSRSPSHDAHTSLPSQRVSLACLHCWLTVVQIAPRVDAIFTVITITIVNRFRASFPFRFRSILFVTFTSTVRILTFIRLSPRRQLRSTQPTSPTHTLNYSADRYSILFSFNNFVQLLLPLGHPVLNPSRSREHFFPKWACLFPSCSPASSARRRCVSSKFHICDMIRAIDGIHTQPRLHTSKATRTLWRIRDALFAVHD